MTNSSLFKACALVQSYIAITRFDPCVMEARVMKKEKNNQCYEEY